MDSRNGIASCKRGDRRLLDKMFESKPIKRGVKSYFNSSKKSLKLLKHPYKQMSSQISNNNNYATAPASLNPYILSGAVHTGVEVHRIDSEMSGLVE